MKDQELKIIQTAIINELEGYEFYKMAHEKTEDPSVKAAFLTLAEEEKKHIDWLKELFEKVRDSDEDVLKLSMMDNPPSPDIFKWENLDRTSASLAVSVFGIGIQMERMSVEFYENAAKRSEITAARSLFDTLAKWEKVHLDMFSSEYDKLQNTWWVDQGFAPF
ncbi:ferritin-like domain-containing protein [Acidaminobacter hydrogenoformans]|uniref:Rubrerythrin n=1 Tax=Acidaminobacter hydrogenoformans DSM 2784 TaxID=1120920 RepID=A0A1G5S6S1_9FIRM|nr:ferritin family protein [Acidaminobacter hydrogenoformans]SCZ82026.1 Rubrerythrin [Acidaminobacter hydrogenoformans DSM 2784]